MEEILLNTFNEVFDFSHCIYLVKIFKLRFDCSSNIFMNSVLQSTKLPGNVE